MPALTLTAPTKETSVRLPMRDYQCATCGYGVSVHDVPEVCPMCRSTVWEPTAWQPFSRLARIPLER
jgi:rubrerythrin